MSYILVSDAALNDSSKDTVVPSGSIYKLLYGHIKLATSGDAGNRRILIEIFDSTDTLRTSIDAGLVQAASTTYHYNLMPGVAREGTIVATSLLIPIPMDLILLPGWYIRVRDSAAIAAAADDMTVSLMFAVAPMN